MKHLLDQPYPFIHQRKYLFFWLLEIFILVTLFDYFVEPFTRNYQEHIYNYLIICMFHAVVVMMAYLITFLTLQFLVDGYRWSIKNEICYAILILMLIGLGNFFIRDLIYNADNWRWDIFWEEMGHGFIAGSLFYFLIANLNRRIVQLIASKDSNQKLLIHAQVSSDSFEVNPKQIICVKSDGNYTVFYLLNGHSFKEKMIRQTLDKIYVQLQPFPQFLRTHRAYIVNLSLINQKMGNSAGYQLSLHFLDFKIPVSRSNVKQFETLWSQT